MDLSSSKFELKPDSFNDTDSLMDGMGMWDYPEEYRLLGEHIAPRVGHRVRTSPFLRVSNIVNTSAITDSPASAPFPSLADHSLMQNRRTKKHFLPTRF